MSNKSKSTKKVISQNELRRIMNEQKKKLPQVVKKIDSPLAKYSETGELRCVLCDSPVRGEALWSAHLASKEHLANIAAAKRSRERMLAPPTKRSLPPPLPPPPAKKPKSILKNSSTSSQVPSDFFDTPTTVKSEVKQEAGATRVKTERRAAGKLLLGQYGSDDEEDAKPKVNATQSKVESSEDEEMEQDPVTNPSDTLPEGFFDDPKLDAKVRNVEYRDPVEDEWERFQRAIKEEAAQSQQIMQEEQEEATAERQLEEIDEQMRNWSRVIELERRKDQVATEIQQPGVEGERMDGIKSENESDDESDFDEFLDWRAKQS